MPYPGREATRAITVAEVSISASVSPTTQKPGATVTFTGKTSGIPSGAKIYLQVYGTDGTWAEPSPACQPTIGADGSFSASWTVPWDARGQTPCRTWRLRFVYYWYTSNEMSLTVYYDTRIRDFTAPDTGVVGQTINITGYLEYNSASGVWSGLAGRKVSIYIDGTKIADVTTNSVGFFSTTYTLDKAGTFTLKASFIGEGAAAAAAATVASATEVPAWLISLAPIVLGTVVVALGVRKHAL